MIKKFTSRRVEREPDLTVLNNGGGVQTGMLMEMLHIALATDIIPVGNERVRDYVLSVRNGETNLPDAIIQADTGDEPKYIYKQWERDQQLAKSMNIPYLVVSNGSLHDDCYDGGRFAAMPVFTRRLTGGDRSRKPPKAKKGQLSLFNTSDFVVEKKQHVDGFGLQSQNVHDGKMRRQCTSEYKIVPIDRELRVMLLEMGLAKERKNGAIVVDKKRVLVESWLGYTTDEYSRVKPSREKWRYFRYPLIEMRLTKTECNQWLIDNNLPSRLSSACIKCPLISNAHMRQLRDNDPAGWESRLKFDDDLRKGSLRLSESAEGELYLHSSFIPMRDVDIDNDNGQLDIMCTHIGCMT